MNKYISISILSLATIFMTGSCSILEGPEEISNPMDPNDPDFVPPKVTFTQAPLEGQTIDTCYVRFEWEGNQPSMNYSYRIDGDNWSDWSIEKTIEYRLLDEGEHLFEIKSKYYNGVETDVPQEINFIIDDIQGPALMFSPRLSKGLQHYTNSIDIVVEEVTDLAMATIVIQFNQDELVVHDVMIYDEDCFMLSNGGTVISFSSYDNDSGKITIDIGVATGFPSGVNGSGAIAQILVEPLLTPWTSGLVFSASSEFRTSDNESIPINEFGNGVVMTEKP